MVFGAIIAQATLADCLYINRIRMGEYRNKWPWLEEHEHTEGPWCWVLVDMRRLDDPVPALGSRGLWDIQIALEKKADERDE